MTACNKLFLSILMVGISIKESAAFQFSLITSTNSASKEVINLESSAVTLFEFSEYPYERVQKIIPKKLIDPSILFCGDEILEYNNTVGFFVNQLPTCKSSQWQDMDLSRNATFLFVRSNNPANTLTPDLEYVKRLNLSVVFLKPETWDALTGKLTDTSEVFADFRIVGF